MLAGSPQSVSTTLVFYLGFSDLQDLNRTALLFHGSSLIVSRIEPHPDITRTLIDAIETFPMAQETNSLTMLIVFQTSWYIEAWHPLSQILLEALDGYCGPHSQQFLLTSRDPLSGSAAGHLADIVFDLMVLVEIENRRRDTLHEGGKYQTKCLKHLLTRVAFYVENAKQPQGLVLPRICGPDMDASCDELDLFRYQTW